MTEKPKNSNSGPKMAPVSTSDAVFRLQDLYPDAAALFAHAHPTVEEIKQTCMVVLDASVLLYAYELKSESFEEIGKVYSRLRDEDRLIVPGQSAREFYKIRPSKVASIVERIDSALHNIERNPFSEKIGLLESNQYYKDAKAKSAEIVNKGKELRNSLTACKSQLEAGVGSDPVSVLYRDLLTSSVIELEMEAEGRDEFLKELEWRNRMQIAPGYTDSGKADGGSGDLLIWHTLLQEASRRKVDCIFITEERKEDWWIKSKGTSFQPRPELIDEYRRASSGKSLFLMPLSTALAHFVVEGGVIEEVQDIEQSERGLEKYHWDSEIYAPKRMHMELMQLDAEHADLSSKIAELKESITANLSELEYVGKFLQMHEGSMSKSDARSYGAEVEKLDLLYRTSRAKLHSLRAKRAQIDLDRSVLNRRIYNGDNP